MKLKIAQVSPLYESVPPKLYGGTERVVSYLTEELVRQGHDVTLFASGDSVTKAKLISPVQEALRLTNSTDQLAPHIQMLQMIQNELHHFDIIHYHIDYLHFPVTRLNPFPTITTMHGRLNIPGLPSLYETYADIPVASISHAQRKPLPWLNWAGNVYHGLPRNLFNPTYEPGKYLAFLGRISMEKRVDRAIEIAIRSGIPLKIAAKIDVSDRQYFEQHIEKLLDHPLIEFIGEINEAEKEIFLGNAKALLFPIDWPEPFGLVMIESMACGTPVIAYNHGSVPEIIDPGRSGIIVNNQDEAVEAVGKIENIDRRICRLAFEERFTPDRMAEDYVKIYEEMIELNRKTKNLKLTAS